MRKKWIARLLAACLLVSLFGGTAATAAETETRVIFSAESVRVTGSGAKLDKDSGDVRITEGGTYRLSGSSPDGRVVVKAGETEAVTLILDGLDLTCPDRETIYVKTAASAVLVLAEGTVNTVVSGGGDAESYDEEEASGAAIRAKCPLTVTGEGGLNVSGYIKNGITATGDLTVVSGDITVYAVNDALTSKANVVVTGGSFAFTAAHDAVQAGESLTVTDGVFTIRTGGGAADADMKVGDSNMMAGGPRRGPSVEAQTASDTGSHKGLKAGERITITGGSFRIDAEDDAVHCDGDISIAGGDLTILTGDDGVHGDDSLTVSGGSIDIQYCFEGLEAPELLVSGGSVSIIAVDDGMNANGGSNMFGPSREASGEAGVQPCLRITGGTVYVDAGGDGLDSNGDLYIEGGEVYVSGPSTNWDAPLDYGEGNSEFLITGGTLMAAGYSGMAETPDTAENSQPCVFYVSDSYAPDGTEVTLTDAAGNVIAACAFAHSFNCVTVSSPSLTVGETYILSIGGTRTELQLTDVLWSNQVRGGFGGPGGPGGMPGFGMRR